MRASTGSKLARIDAHQRDRRGAVVQRRGIPGGDAAVGRRNAGRSWASCCSLVSRRGCSSSVTNRAAVALRTLTGTISSTAPRRLAAAALRWELAAKVTALAADVEGVGEGSAVCPCGSR